MKINLEKLQAEKAAQVESFLKQLTAQMAELPTLVVIGGFAVRAHGAKRLSLDGDIMVTHSTHGELRDQFTLFKNPRLGKEQFSTPFGAEIDVYVEDQHKLRIPFDEIQAYVEKRNGLWVACAEHLLILKLDALRDRRHSDKGAKDIEDIFVLVSQAQFKHQPVLKDRMTADDWRLLDEIIGTPGHWQQFTQHDHKKAAMLQKKALGTLKALRGPRSKDVE